MRDAIEAVLGPGGVASRQELVRAIGRSTVDDLVRRRELAAVFPRAYARPWDVHLSEVRLRAAVLSVGGEVALSHTTATERWGLLTNAPAIHVTAFQPRHPRGVPDALVVHRTLLPLRACFRDGLPIVLPAVAAITSWPLLAGPEQRAAIIEGCRRRLMSVDQLLAAARAAGRQRGMRDLRQLISAVAAGCESELELWGYRSVFTGPGLVHGVRQRVFRVGGRVYRGDLAYEEERVLIELDGRRFHASPARWADDIARDLSLATLGWQTVRLSHARLTSDVAGVRRDVLAVLAARRLAGRPGRLTGTGRG